MSNSKLSLTFLFESLWPQWFSLASHTAASGNNPDVEWQKGYGTSSGIPKVIQTIDGGFVFIEYGWSYQMTTLPTTLNKIDSFGNLVWSKNVRAVDLTQSYSGGYAMLQSVSKGAALVQFDSDDKIQWNVTYPNYFVHSGCIVGTNDSGYLIAINNSSNSDYLRVESSGYRYPTTWLIKADWSGNIQWARLPDSWN